MTRLAIIALLVLAAAPATGQIAFSEQAQQAGLITGAGAAGVSVFDFDGDGRDDITFGVEAARPAIFRNNGDGTFTDVAESLGIDLDGRQVMPVWVDLDNDGTPELFLGTKSGPNRLFVRSDDGAYVDRIDDFGLDASAELGSVSFGDFDDDGLLDLFMAVDRAPDKLYRNIDGQSFEDVTSAAGVEGPAVSVAMQASWMDVDRDGDQDLFAVHDGRTPSRLHLNNGFFPFYDQAPGRGVDDVGAGNSMGVIWGDVNLDGWPDVYVSRIDSAGLFINQGDARFKDEAGARGAWVNGMSWGSVFSDFDNDGDEDLFVVSTTGFDGTKMLLYENNDGTFVDVSENAGVSVSSESMGLAAGDFNNDGRIDLVLPSLNGTHRLFINETPSAGNWLRVRLTGTAANRLGVGARVEVSAGGRTMTRWVTAGDSFCSQNSPVLHFGLGPTDTIDSTRIVWNGSSETAVTAPVNGTVEVAQAAATDRQTGGELPESVLIASVYPNPARSRATVGLTLETASTVRVRLIDALGRPGELLATSRLPAGRSELTFDVPPVASGAYLLRVETTGTDGIKTVRSASLGVIR